MKWGIEEGEMGWRNEGRVDEVQGEGKGSYGGGRKG